VASSSSWPDADEESADELAEVESDATSEWRGLNRMLEKSNLNRPRALEIVDGSLGFGPQYMVLSLGSSSSLEDPSRAATQKQYKRTR
jgi:hypothetical protein